MNLKRYNVKYKNHTIKLLDIISNIWYFFDEVARRTLTDFNFEIEEGYDGQQCLDKVKVGMNMI